MTSAPQAIWDGHNYLEAHPHRPASYVMAGIVGDVLHSFGYHLSLNVLPSGDYSLQLTRDRNGAHAHPDLASAWDLHFGPADMIVVTKRLIAAALAGDRRIVGVLREFCGTTNGTSPHPFDVASMFNDVNNTEGWDYSHVTHVHLSFLRDCCTNAELVKGVVDVICGVPTTEEFIMDDESRKAFAALNGRVSTMERMISRTDADVAAALNTVINKFALVMRGDPTHPDNLHAVLAAVAGLDPVAHAPAIAALKEAVSAGAADDAAASDPEANAPMSTHAGPTAKRSVTDEDVIE